MTATVVADSRHWHASLQLGFVERGGRSVLDQCRHQGPLRVQRPFYPEGAPCHVYVLHPPGGIVGGDCLQIQARVQSGAHALLTTPASAKFYRSDGRRARQLQQLDVATQAALEWLPQDTIVFDGCLAETSTHVQLAAGARFIGWELFSLGRPASGEGFTTGSLRQRFEVWRAERPLLIERTAVDGNGTLLRAAWGLGDQPSYATLVATPADAQTLATARSAVPDHLVAFTLKGDLLVGRALARQSQELQRRLAAVWSAIRPQIMGRDPCPPRIWNT